MSKTLPAHHRRFSDHRSATMSSGPAPAVLNLFAAPRMDCPVSWPLEFSVWLDRGDRIVFVSPQWEAFAATNFQPALTAAQVLNRPVADFIQDGTTGECFRTLFERVRREHRAARMVTRCDLPAEPRAMRLTVTPLSDGAIECAWTFLRPAAAAFIGHTPHRWFHHGELVRMCGWCRSVHMAWTWQPLEIAGPSLGLFDRVALPSITHGICPECRMMLAEETETTLVDTRQAV